MMARFAKKLRLVLGKMFVPAHHLQQQQLPRRLPLLQPPQQQQLLPQQLWCVMAVTVKGQPKS